jgi:hypothetical protein
MVEVGRMVLVVLFMVRLATEEREGGRRKGTLGAVIIDCVDSMEGARRKGRGGGLPCHDRRLLCFVRADVNDDRITGDRCEWRVSLPVVDEDVDLDFDVVMDGMLFWMSIR